MNSPLGLRSTAQPPVWLTATKGTIKPAMMITQKGSHRNQMKTTKVMRKIGNLNIKEDKKRLKSSMKNQKIQQDKENVPNATCKQVEVRILNKATKGPKKSLKSQCNAKEASPDKMIMIKQRRNEE